TIAVGGVTARPSCTRRDSRRGRRGAGCADGPLNSKPRVSCRKSRCADYGYCTRPLGWDVGCLVCLASPAPGTVLGSQWLRARGATSPACMLMARSAPSSRPLLTYRQGEDGYT